MPRPMAEPNGADDVRAAGDIAPDGNVPLPPLNGVRCVRRSIPVFMSLASLKALTAACSATRPTSASSVASSEARSS